MNVMKKIQDIKMFSKAKKKAKPSPLPKFTVTKKAKSTKSWKDMEFSLFSYTSFSVKKQTFFAKRLSFLIRAGVPMLESMHVIKAQAKGRNETKIFQKIINDVANGQTLSNSLRKFKNIFGNFTINVVKAGESSGTLMKNLDYLAEELKKRSLLRKKIKSALIYPAIITVATFGLTGFLTLYIFPKIIPIFSSLGAGLPFTTRAIIWLTQFLRGYGLIILGILVLLTIAFIFIKKHIFKVQFFYDGLLLRLPIIGAIVKNYNLTNIMRTMSILLNSGMSLNESLAVASDTTDNVRYKKAFEHISKGVMKGQTVSHLIKKYTFLFPPMLTHMLSIGEKSGNLSNTFGYLSEYYEHEFEEQTRNLSSTIEPVLMIIMGIMVGFVAISIISPIYELTGSISR